MAKDRKIDMVILGLLFHEKLTGYDIKKRIDNGIGFFWKGSYGSIYPALTAMEADGLIVKTIPLQESSGREKIFYQITNMGKDRLALWLQDSKATNDLKYETMLKVFFGGAVDEGFTLETITRFENEIKDQLGILKMYKENLAHALTEPDHIYYYLTVMFGVETYEGYLKWCEEAKAILK